ncbi:MAG: sterol desaturase family protein [Bdellovibrio sp.]
MQNHFEKFESYIPVDLNQPVNFFLAFSLITAIVAFRYYLMVYPFYWLFYRLRPAKFAGKLLYPDLPTEDSQREERRWSLLSSGIFGLVGAIWGVLWQNGWTRIYLSFDDMGWAYLAISPFLLILLHETYFYWTHRALHLPIFYRRWHWVHHRSWPPSPWASFSFHPVESLINALILPLMSLLIPVHPLVFIFHLTLMTLTAITNHLGFEVLPRGAWAARFGRHVVSGFHHTQHHRYFKYNYSLFLTFWDRWMSTEDPRFEREWATRNLQKVSSSTGFKFESEG